MSTYAKPIIPLIESPINLDKVIQGIQIKLGQQLEWLDYSFGRATLGARVEDENRRPAYYPEVYVGKGEYQSVEPNNHYGSHCFIQVAGPEKSVEYDKFQFNTYGTELEAVFWFDLDKVKAKMGWGHAHRFTEELKAQIRGAFRKMGEVTKINAIYEAPADVFKGYSLNHVEGQTFKHPYGGFKFSFSVSYVENC